MAAAEIIQLHPEGQAPPWAPDAELAVLAAVMLDPSAMPKVTDFLEQQHFYMANNGWLFAACLDLHKAGQVIDPMTVAEHLRAWDRYNQVGGTQGLLEMLDASPAPQNVRAHARIVHDKWRARQVITAAQRLAATGYADYGDTQEYCDGAVRVMLGISRQTVMGQPESNRDALVRIATQLQRDVSSATPRAIGIPTGIQPYDELTHGLHPGHKTTICALPGVGKTAFAMQVAWDVARRGVGVLVFSTEMSRDELLTREMSRRAKVDGDNLKARRFGADAWPRITQAATGMATEPIVILDDASVHIGQVRTITRSYAESFRAEFGVPLGLVVLDYVQNLGPPPGMERAVRHEAVGATSSQFKQLVKSLDIAGLELAQRKTPSSDGRSRATPWPRKGDVADSGMIEKCADQVAYLHRNPQTYGGKTVGEDPRSVRVVFTKHRGGREDSFNLVFEGEFSAFRDDVGAP